MAGRKQHYVPRFLQAGFRNRPQTADGAPRTWLYLPGAKPVEAALSDVGHDAWFYTFRRNGVTIECADGAISEAERTWMSSLVRSLREDAAFDLEGRHAEISHLLSHLVLRNRAVWKLIEAPAAPLFDKLRDAAQDPVWLAGSVKQLLEANRPFFEEALSAMYPGADIRALLDQAESAFAAGNVSPASEGAMSMLKFMRDSLLPRVLNVLRVRVMGDALRDPSQFKLFRDCSFEVVRCEDRRLIQGDTPVVFHKANGTGFTPVSTEGEDFDYAFMPLAPSVFLLAAKGGRPSSLDDLRDASAACSHTYFIAAEQADALTQLAQTIGKSFPVPTQQQINGMFAESLSEVGSFDTEDTELTAVFDTLFADFLGPTPPMLTNA
ncbi:conserved hypothetical protein [Thiomonas sp. CB2]|nr:conserved hypothetical protein [Thiomonas sp. CB2]